MSARGHRRRKNRPRTRPKKKKNLPPAGGRRGELSRSAPTPPRGGWCLKSRVVPSGDGIGTLEN